MEITVLAFGQMAEITGKSSWVVQDFKDTNTLITGIENEYPEAKKIKYLVAVNQQVVSDNTVLANHATVALLPPFSGG